MTEKDLNGTSRVAVEGFATEEECKMLIKLAEVCNLYEPLLMINYCFCHVPCVVYSIIVFVFVKGEKLISRKSTGNKSCINAVAVNRFSLLHSFFIF